MNCFTSAISVYLIFAIATISRLGALKWENANGNLWEVSCVAILRNGAFNWCIGSHRDTETLEGLIWGFVISSTTIGHTWNELLQYRNYPFPITGSISSMTLVYGQHMFLHISNSIHKELSSIISSTHQLQCFFHWSLQFHFRLTILFDSRIVIDQYLFLLLLLVIHSRTLRLSFAGSTRLSTPRSRSRSDWLRGGFVY